MQDRNYQISVLYLAGVMAVVAPWYGGDSCIRKQRQTG